MRPADALARRDALEIELAPPTWMTLHYLARVRRRSTSSWPTRTRASPATTRRTWARATAGLAAMWPGDAGYESGDVDAPGPRHRLWMPDDGWWLEQTD